MIRLFITPIIGDGSEDNPFRTKAADFGYQYSAFLPAKADGTPKFLWVLVVLKSNNFTAIDADTSCDDLLQGDLPAGINTKAEFIAFLKSRTVGDVPLARRQAIIAVFDKYGIDRSDFTLQTSLWRCFRRAVSHLMGEVPEEEF